MPYIGWAAIVLISGAVGFSLYQVKYAVKDVTEVFTSETSILNSGAVKISLLVLSAYLIMKTFR